MHGESFTHISCSRIFLRSRAFEASLRSIAVSILDFPGDFQSTLFFQFFWLLSWTGNWCFRPELWRSGILVCSSMVNNWIVLFVYLKDEVKWIRCLTWMIESLFLLIENLDPQNATSTSNWRSVSVLRDSGSRFVLRGGTIEQEMLENEGLTGGGICHKLNQHVLYKRIKYWKERVITIPNKSW